MKNNWYKNVKIAVPNLEAEDFPEDIENVERNPHTLRYYDKQIDPELKKKLDEERKRKYIGHGAYGIAYESEDIEKYNPTGKLVEKYTRDPAEYEVAMNIIASQINAEDYPFAKVFYAEELKLTDDYNYEEENVFRIFLEYIEPADDLLAMVYNIIDIAAMDFLDLNDKNSILTTAYDLLYDESLDYLPPAQENMRQIFRKKEPVYINSYLKKIYYLMLDLEKRILKYNFVPADMHGENIGTKKGRLYILDLGAVVIPDEKVL